MFITISSNNFLFSYACGVKTMHCDKNWNMSAASVSAFDKINFAEINVKDMPLLG